MTYGDVATGAEGALARLEVVLRSLGHPLLDLLEPGLTSEQIIEAMAPTSLTLPHEAAAVWRWRNGLRPGTYDPTATPRSNELPGGFVPLGLHRAADMYLRNLADFPWDQLDDLARDWFPFAIGSGYTMWVDCAGVPDRPARLISRYTSDYNPPEELERCSVPSVTRGIEVWTALLERGIWTVVGPGDTVSFDGQPLVLGDTAPQRWGYVRDPDEDLPQGWPC